MFVCVQILMGAPVQAQWQLIPGSWSARSPLPATPRPLCWQTGPTTTAVTRSGSALACLQARRWAGASLSWAACSQESCPAHVCAVPALDSDSFCGATVDYSARLANASDASGQVLPPRSSRACRSQTLSQPTSPGCLQAEDEYAACQYNNWQFTLLLDDCRDTQLWTCADCAAAYKAWLCATVFQRCQDESPDLRVPTCRNTCFVRLFCQDLC